MNKKYSPILKKRYPKSLQNCLDDFKKSWEDLDKLFQMNENWCKIIGEELYMECKPLKIEKGILTIAVNQPHWRQALIYNKHKLKDTIKKLGINLKEIKIIQNYEGHTLRSKGEDARMVWENHPSRVNKNMVICKICNCPAPKGELLRWGKCTFCWRKNS